MAISNFVQASETANSAEAKLNQMVAECNKIFGKTVPAGATLVDTTSTQTLSGKTLTAPVISGGSSSNGARTGGYTVEQTALSVASGGAGFLGFVSSENLTANRGLILTLHDASRGIDLSGNLTLGGSFTTSGAFSTVLTATGTTTLTLPTTGTLATLAGAETFTNKTLTSPTVNGGTKTGGSTVQQTALSIRSSGAAHDVSFVSTEALTGNKTLFFNLADANRSIVLGGNFSIGGSVSFVGSSAAQFTIGGATIATFPTGTFTVADTSSAQTFALKTLTAPVINTATINTSNMVGGTATGLTNLSVTSAGAGKMRLLCSSSLSADRTLIFDTGDVNRGVTIGGNLSFGGAFSTIGGHILNLTTTATTNITLPTTGTLTTDEVVNPKIVANTDYVNAFTDSYYMGLPNTPSDQANNFAGGTMVFTEVARSDGVWNSVEIYSFIGRTITLGVFTKSGDTYTQVRSAAAFTTTGGLQTYNLFSLKVNKGELIGYTGAGGGSIDFAIVGAGASLTPFVSGTLSGGSFDDDTVSTVNQMQFRATIRSLTEVATERSEREAADDALAFLISSSSPEQVIGLPREPTGAPSSSGAAGFTFVFDPAFEADGILRTLEVYSGTAGTGSIDIYSHSGSTFTLLRNVATVSFAANTMNPFDLNFDVNEGEMIGITPSTGGWSEYTSVGSGSRTPYYLGTLSGGSFTDVAPDASLELEIRITLQLSAELSVNALNSDKFIAVGQSFEPGYDQPEDLNWHNIASPWDRRQWEIWAVGGTTWAEITGYLRGGTVGYGRPFMSMRGTIVGLYMGKNNEIDGTTPEDFVATGIECVELCKNCGAAKVFVFTEFDNIYAPGGANLYRQICDATGAIYVNTYSHAKEMVRVPPTTGLFQGTYGAPLGWHMGARSANLRADVTLAAINSLEDPRQYVKYYSKRDFVSPIADVDDLIFRNDVERNDLFKEVPGGSIHMADADAGYYDRLDLSGTYRPNVVVKMSERLSLSNGGTFDFGDYALVQAGIPSSIENIRSVSMAIDDEDADIYVLDWRPSGGIDWTLLTQAVPGKVRLTFTDLRGRFNDGEIYFLIVNTTDGVVIREPKIRYSTAQQGKFQRLPKSPQPEPKGATLMSQELVSVSAPWTGAGGASVDPAPWFKLPADFDGVTYTGAVNVTASKTLTQALTFTTSAVKDREFVVRVKAIKAPAQKSDPLTGTILISADTVNHREVIVTLIDGSGQRFPYRCRSKNAKHPQGHWWNWQECRPIIPMDCAAMDIEISATGTDVFVTEVRADFLE